MYNVLDFISASFPHIPVSIGSLLRILGLLELYDIISCTLAAVLTTLRLLAVDMVRDFQ